MPSSVGEASVAVALAVAAMLRCRSAQVPTKYPNVLEKFWSGAELMFWKGGKFGKDRRGLPVSCDESLVH